MKRLLLTVAALLCAGLAAADADVHADGVVAEILGNVAKLKAARPDAVPMPM